jgi:hypothetical protein
MARVTFWYNGSGLSRLLPIASQPDLFNAIWCFKEMMKMGGGNGYNVSHIRKGVLERQRISHCNSIVKQN